MISAKNLIKMAKKWQKVAASKRKRIALPKATGAVEAESCSISLVADKGHFVVYTADQKRFVIPLKYLKNDIIKELFTMAEDEFGLPSGVPITFPCDAIFMEYAFSLIRRHAKKDVEKAFLMSLATVGYLPSSHLHQAQSNQPPLICSF